MKGNHNATLRKEKDLKGKEVRPRGSVLSIGIRQGENGGFMGKCDIGSKSQDELSQGRGTKGSCLARSTLIHSKSLGATWNRESSCSGQEKEKDILKRGESCNESQSARRISSGEGD